MNDNPPCRLQTVANARTCDTGTRIDFEQGVMRGALNEGAVHVEKLVFLPFEVDAGMRATVDIAREITVLVHDKQGKLFTSLLDFKRFRSGISDFFGRAKWENQDRTCAICRVVG